MGQADESNWPTKTLEKKGVQTSLSYADCNLFIKHLPGDVNDEKLRDLFIEFGDVVSAKVAVNPLAQTTLGYGFVLFKEASSAKQAMEKMDGKVLEGKILLVEPALKSETTNAKLINTNLYVKHLLPETTEMQVVELFEKYGEVQSCILLRDKLTNKTRMIAMIRFATAASASAALKALNGTYLDPALPPLLVRYANPTKRKTEAKMKRKSDFHSETTSTQKNQASSSFVDELDGGMNLFVFHIPEAWGDSDLLKIFEPFGAIENGRVMLHMKGENKGKSRGFGFVKFRDAQNALTAMNKLNGKAFAKKKLLIKPKKES
eukprot:c16898_g1_i1.p1 GENE.c16898_g1_i1~~c16898_g1_i1.p1  ORF type:complete len:319 (-),score=92.58 c16898_g1_i1:19-975(-)